MTLEDRFNKKWVPEPYSGCWLWTGARGSFGHGLMKTRTKKNDTAPRISWTIHRGEIPTGLCVLHKCDVPECVNPDHLFLGTKRDNAIDSALKGRHADFNGTKNGRCRLSVEQVREIRSSSETHKTLAKRFGVGKSTIGYVRNGTNWRNIK